MADLKNLKNVSAQDRKMLQETEAMMGPEPSEMGLIKNLFWGNFREDLAFPYPQMSAEEQQKTETLLKKLEDYLQNEHPSVQIDQEEEIPQWVIKRLFDMGVLGMTIPEEYGGMGLGITSYNKVLERIGRTCASTSVLVSTHQSVGCKAIILFGTEAQKKEWLPLMATSKVSAFSLSEPNVGCDAGGQETRCELSEDGTHYILNGEKKWSTNAAWSGLFTIMCKQKLKDPKSGKEKDGVTALICTPDMEGIDIYEKNRSKCGIRGTWQGRIRLTNVKVPRGNLLHKEGQGLKVALTCLNYGRCTLSSGILGAAKGAMDQATKWSQTRHQFGRSISSFELVQKRVANMSALCYAMDSVIYLTTGMLDRHDKDIMVETAAIKVFASEMGGRVIDDAMQIMGGEGYMTENELERSYRDARIYRVVEGANEVMQAFIFGYGGKQLAEQMVGIQQAFFWNGEEGFGENLSRIFKNGLNLPILSRALRLGLQLFLGIKQSAPSIHAVHPSLQQQASRLAKLISIHNHQFKLMSKKHREAMLKRQLTQARLGDNAMWIYAMTAVLAKLDSQIRNNQSSAAFERDKTAALHFLDLAEHTIRENIRALNENSDVSMANAAKASLDYNDSLPNEAFIIPEASPIATGTGRPPNKKDIKQFPGDTPTSKEEVASAVNS